MSRHVSDEQIQDMLDGSCGPDVQVVQGHLDVCRACRDNRRIYEVLYTGLKHDPGFILSPRFAETVLERMDQSRWRIREWVTSPLTIALALFSLGMGIILAYMNTGPVMESMGRLGGAMARYIKLFGQPIGQLFAPAKEGMSPILIAVLAFIWAAAADRVFRHFREKINS